MWGEISNQPTTVTSQTHWPHSSPWSQLFSLQFLINGHSEQQQTHLICLWIQTDSKVVGNITDFIYFCIDWPKMLYCLELSCNLRVTWNILTCSLWLVTQIYKKKSSEIFSCLKKELLSALNACSSVKPHISKCACPNVHDGGVHGQDRLLMAGMSDDRNAWRMTACKQKTKYGDCHGDISIFHPTREYEKKDTTGSFRKGRGGEREKNLIL